MAYEDIIARAAAQHGVDPDILRRMLQAESAGNPNARSPVGAQGLMQLMPATAQELGVTNPYDPEQNIMGGARYFRQQMDRFGGDPRLALAAYNAGPGNVQKYGGVPPFAETQAYVEKIAGSAPQQAEPDFSMFNAAPQEQYDFSMFDPPQKSLGGFLGNVASSAGNLLGGVAQTVMHPIETAKNVGQMGLGAAELLIPGEQGHEQAARNVGEFYKQRYGGVGNVAETLYQDPVGVLGDVSLLAGGAGLAAKAGQAGKLASMAGKVASVTDPLAMLASPLRGTRAAGAALETGGKKMWLSAVKPSTTMPLKKRMELATTGLTEGGNVTARSLAKQGRKIQSIESSKAPLLAQADLAGAKVPAKNIPGYLKQTKHHFSMQATPQDDLATINKAIEDFSQNPAVSKPRFVIQQQMVPSGLFDAQGNPILHSVGVKVPKGRQYTQVPVSKAEALKKGTYQAAGKYGERGSAGNEAQKALGRGLREEIGKAVSAKLGPHEAARFTGLNAREGRLIELQHALEGAVKRLDNRDRIGLKTMIGGAASVGTGNILPFLASLIDQPSLKTHMARAVYRAGRGLQTGKLPTRVTRPTRRVMLGGATINRDGNQ